MKRVAAKLLRKRTDAEAFGWHPHHDSVQDVLRCTVCASTLHSALSRLRELDERNLVPGVPAGSMDRREAGRKGWSEA